MTHSHSTTMFQQKALWTLCFKSNQNYFKFADFALKSDFEKLFFFFFSYSFFFFITPATIFAATEISHKSYFGIL